MKYSRSIPSGLMHYAPLFTGILLHTCDLIIYNYVFVFLGDIYNSYI